MLTVLCAGAASAVIQVLAHAFALAHGGEVVVQLGTVGQLRGRLDAGAPADVVILSAPAIDALATQGAIVGGTRADLGRTGIGVGVRSGTPAPDLSTPDALKAALLAAPTIASTDPAAGASSGIYFAGLLTKMGIADAVRPKEKLVPGGFSCDLVARGEASLCVQNISEIVPVKGVALAGPFPAALQNYITYTAAIVTRSTDEADARAFIAYITAAPQAATLQKAGFER